MAERPPSPPRRGLLGAGILAALIVGPAQAQAPAGGVYVVSRERILQEATAARRLHDAETRMTAELQSKIDETKSAFADEEEELTRLRAELPPAEFQERVGDFDQRVRRARRGAQALAALLQKGFQEARADFAAAMPALMEQLRLETGAAIIANADDALAFDPAVDLTDRAIALFDAEGPSPAVPQIDLSGPLFDIAPQDDEAAPDAEGEPGR